MRLPAQVQVGRKDGWSSNDRIRLIGSLTERVPQGALSYFSVSVAGTASASGPGCSCVSSFLKDATGSIPSPALIVLTEGLTPAQLFHPAV